MFHSAEFFDGPRVNCRSQVASLHNGREGEESGEGDRSGVGSVTNYENKKGGKRVKRVDRRYCSRNCFGSKIKWFSATQTLFRSIILYARSDHFQFAPTELSRHSVSDRNWTTRLFGVAVELRWTDLWCEMTPARKRRAAARSAQL